MYYGDNTCQNVNNTMCPYDNIYCEAGAYRDNNNNTDVCRSCPEDFPLSRGNNNTNKTVCYTMCEVPCTKAACPDHATCDYDWEPVCDTTGTTVDYCATGKQFWGSSTCNAGETCAMEVNCNLGYELDPSDVTCKPVVYEITLHDTKNNTNAIIYEKYATGWYSSASATASTEISSVTPPTYSYWVFGGYYTQANGGGDQIIAADGTIVAGNTTFTADTELYAKWTATTYTVKYACGTGTTGNPPADDTATYDSEFEFADNNTCAKVGYHFIGWTDGTINVEAGDKILWEDTTENKTFTARWAANTYTVTLQKDTTIIDTVSATYNSAMPTTNTSNAALTMPTDTKAVFKGYMGNNTWYYTSALTSAHVWNQDGNGSLNAVFQNCSCQKGTNVATCLVTGVTNNKCQYSYTCTDGYNNGGNTSGTFEGSVATASNTSPNCASGNTITLVWDNDGHGTAPSEPATCTYGTNFTTAAAITGPTDYTFEQWSINNKTFDGSASIACNSTNLGITSGTATFVATWSPNAFTVTLKNGSTTVDTVTAIYNHQMPTVNNNNVALTMPTSDNAVFQGYFDATSGGTQYYTSSLASAHTWDKVGEQTLNAQFTSCTCALGTGVSSCSPNGVTNNKCQYSVTCSAGYSENGGIPSTRTFAVTNDTAAQASYTANCVKNDVLTVALDSQYYTGSTATTGVAADTQPSYTTLYEWYDNGWYTDNTTNNTFTALATIPAYSTYTFGGFYTGKAATGDQVIDATGNLNSNMTKKFASNATIYAKWTTCDACDPAVGTNCTLSVVNNVCTYATSCQTGYDNITGDGTATPSCTPNTYTISYVLNGGAYGTGHPTSATYDDAFTVNNPTHAHGTFAGWNIAGMDGVTHTYGESTTTDNSISGTSETNFMNLRSTAGTVTFTATWDCDTGYEGANCTAIVYDVKYECGTDTTGSAPADDTATYDAEFEFADNNTCAKRGYHFDGWTDGITTKNAGDSIVWKYTENKTFTVKWTPNVYEITLDHSNATTPAGYTTLYMKYDTGWFTDPSATDASAITVLNPMPQKTGYDFVAYTFDDEEIIDINGEFVTTSFTDEPVTITAEWAPGITVCAPGYYYTGPGAVCVLCEPNSYCLGGNYTTDDGVDGTHACPNGGRSPAGTSDVESCTAVIPYTGIQIHGSGTQTCYYDADAKAYVENSNCIDKTITSCDGGYYYNASAVSASAPVCVPVGPNYYSPDGLMTREACPPDYPKSYGDTTDTIDLCYRECEMAPHASEMEGREYYDATRTTCHVKICQAGYYRDALGNCEPCLPGSYCPGNAGTNGDGLISCSTLGSSADGFTTWSLSLGGVGSDAKEDCYSNCTDHELTATGYEGVAHPKAQTVNWNNICTFTGESINGNPCDESEIPNNKCVEIACRSDYEMVDGRCEPCSRDENALTYESTGNCIVALCKTPDLHPEGYKCVPNVKSCTESIPHAEEAVSEWVSTLKSFGACKVTECANGYHIESNTCVPNERTCDIANGNGRQTWDTNMNRWEPCEVVSCDPGYTDDEDEKIGNTPCGVCKNKFGLGGEQAVSSYVRGCEVASCMYQGEKYALEDGVCKAICEDSEDALGNKKRWNPRTRKCDITCAPGYIPW